MKHIHPFPARMAPELALSALEGLSPHARVLDPMSGSGTVLRHASFAGHKAIGFDMDPLAVLIARVSSRKVDIDSVETLCNDLLNRVSQLKDVILPWMDNSRETTRFVNYWFGRRQRNALRKLAFALRQIENKSVGNEKHSVEVLKVALSRIIITKENGASLARDVSHSRPHKVRDSSDYDAINGFLTSATKVVRFLRNGLPPQNAVVKLGDARELIGVPDASVDLVVTSPPYLNAIDYLRGHKMSLVWLGYTIEELRNIRSESIGSERRLKQDGVNRHMKVESAMVDNTKLPASCRGMVSRYARDVSLMIGEIVRVLKSTGKAVLVVGDCCVRSEFVSNSDGIKKAASLSGLRLVSQTSRELPSRSRYLPIMTASALNNRLRTENVLTFSSF